MPPSPPKSEPALRMVPMPSDANPNGDIFGGWVLAQMDIAGAVPAVICANGPVVTVAVEAMRFHAPISVGDMVTFYAKIVQIGNTSITTFIETWARHQLTGSEVKVTEGIFVYVAIDKTGQPRSVLGKNDASMSLK